MYATVTIGIMEATRTRVKCISGTEGKKALSTDDVYHVYI